MKTNILENAIFGINQAIEKGKTEYIAYPVGKEQVGELQKILRNLCDLKLLKVYFNLSDGIRYRIQKRVGKTRKRYITFNRGEFEKTFEGGLL